MAQTITQSSDETVQTFRWAPGLLSAMIIVAQCAVESWGRILVNFVKKWSGGDLFSLLCHTVPNMMVIDGYSLINGRSATQRAFEGSEWNRCFAFCRGPFMSGTSW